MLNIKQCIYTQAGNIWHIASIMCLIPIGQSTWSSQKIQAKNRRKKSNTVITHISGHAKFSAELIHDFWYILNFFAILMGCNDFVYQLLLDYTHKMCMVWLIRMKEILNSFFSPGNVILNHISLIACVIILCVTELLYNANIQCAINIFQTVK